MSTALTSSAKSMSGDEMETGIAKSVSFDEFLERKTSSLSPLYCLKDITHAVIMCMSLLFMKCIALESIVGTTSIATKNQYGWSIKNVGMLHLINGCIVIPVSILAGWLSQFYEDQFLVADLLVACHYLFGNVASC